MLGLAPDTELVPKVACRHCQSEDRTSSKPPSPSTSCPLEEIGNSSKASLKCKYHQLVCSTDSSHLYPLLLTLLEGKG